MSILNWKNKVLGHTPQGGGGKGGGGGGGGAQQQSNQYTSISPWAQPYVSSLLGAAQNQIFQTKPTAAIPGTPDIQKQIGTDENGQPIYQTIPGTPGTPAGSEITGLRPYTAYGMEGAGLSPEAQAAAQASVAGFTPMQQQAFQGAANLQVPGQYAAGSNFANQAGIGALGTTGQAAQYGAQGSNQANMYGGLGAQTGQQYGGLSALQGQQGANIGASLGQMSTNPNAIQAYMNPYIQASLQPQLNLLAQQTGIQGAAQQGAATSAGAFGGSRSALQNALVQQAGNLAQQQAIGQGYNAAFNQAQQQMNAANQAALAGNQQALAGYGQAGSQALQGLGMGLQGATQGAQLGLQGVGAQQAGYGLAGQQGANLANIGAGQLAAQQGILGLQNQFGTQQQQQQQNVINQAMQNYLTAQQYPMSQLQQLSTLGMPYITKDVTATQQQATASPISQLAGLGTAGIAGLGLYNAMNKKS